MTKEYSMFQRLTILANFLESDAVPDEHFNMFYWARSSKGFYCGGEVSEYRLHECETAACAADWATMVPGFREQGLKLVIRTEGATVAGIACGFDRGFMALRNFFSLTSGQADYIFDPETYPGIELDDKDKVITKAQVIKRIRELVANDGVYDDAD